MDVPSFPSSPQPAPSETPCLESNPDGDSLYNREDDDFFNATVKYVDDLLREQDLEATTPFNSLHTMVPHYTTDKADNFSSDLDPPPFPTNSELPTATVQSSAVVVTSGGENSPYNRETYNFSKTLLKYIEDVLMEEELEDTPVTGFNTQVQKYINLTDCTPVNGFEPPYFPTNLQPPDTGPSSSSSSSSSPSLVWASDGDKSSYNTAYCYPAALKHINDMLMEGDLEYRPGTLQDCLELQAAEKSFYDVLVEMNSTSSDQMTGSASENCVPCSSVESCSSYNCNRAVNLAKSRARRNHERDGDGYLEEGRSNKHSLGSLEEYEQLEMIDSGFIQNVNKKETIPCPLYDASKNEASKEFQREARLLVSNTRVKRLIGDTEKVDLWALLNQCAQAAASGDQRGAAEKLKQISQHSSPYGDANQRLAHYFATGLEARLAAHEKISHVPIFGHQTAAAEILKAYQLYVSICPFRRMSNFWTTWMITKEAEKGTSLHIIDFGIGYGFQWPCFLHYLSTRPGGPPRIKITGIDFPQPGFRPAERLEETGRRLKRLAATFNVPFEYNAIAQRWETVRYEDLNIDRNEVTAVTCLYRLRYLPDDTMVHNSQRDAVLKLIRKINPDIFVHGVLNGSFNSPFFLTRFREALFHFSAMFDIFEANTPREDQERLIFEREMIGKDAINVIACEGFERVERPETYKQWQSRNCRIGFRQLPLEGYAMRRVRSIKTNYHEDFIVDEDGPWMLMGWKGRIIQALSAWKPVQS